MFLRIAKISGLFLLFSLVAGASAYLTLTLFIKSEDTVVVPDLLKKDVVYVLELLTDLGLNTKVKGFKYSSGIPKNKVIIQEPEAGAEIKKGRDIKIILSKGPKYILMPNLLGLPGRQGRIILEENDLRPGQISYTNSLSVGKDEIVAQFPSPGMLVQRQGITNLLLSAGKEGRVYKMPSLQGLSLNEALLLIDRFKLQPGKIKSSFRKNKPKNIIFKQDPLAGYPVKEGSSVNLVINRKQVEEDGKPLQVSEGVRLFRHKLEKGFLKKHVRVQVNSYGTSIDFYNDFMEPGKEIWVLIPTNQDATVFLYEDGRLIGTKIYDAYK
ncbi:PASTA domain-containing protein [Thermodesulfobacteriota bacterium]